MQSEIIISQIIMLGIVVIIGVIAARLKIITESLKEGIASLVFNITLPLLILSSFTDMEITWELLRNGIMVIIFSYFSLFFMLITGKISARLQKMKKGTSSIHILHTAFGNVVFLGFPLMDALFPGGRGLFYATLFYLVLNSVMWTAGVNIISNKPDKESTGILKNLLNPNTIAFILGIVLMLSGFSLPGVIDVPLSGLGQTTHYLSMLYIGGMLAQTNIRGVFGRGRVYLLSLNKMVLSPAILIVLFSLLLRLLSLDIDPVAFSVVILQSGTPCMAIIVVLAKKFNVDDIHATENVFVTTLFSILTLPFLYRMIEAIAF